MRLSEWLALVPAYDGCPHLFGKFAESVKFVADQVSPDHHGALLLALAEKLRGDAGEIFKHKLHRYKSIEDLLHSMYLYFSDRSSYQVIMDKLWNSRREDSESVKDYARRVDRMHTLLYNIHQYDSKITTRERDLAIEAIDKTALVCFERGLRSAELEFCVAASRPTTLQQAIDAAIFASGHPNWHAGDAKGSFERKPRRRRFVDSKGSRSRGKAAKDSSDSESVHRKNICFSYIFKKNSSGRLLGAAVKNVR